MLVRLNDFDNLFFNLFDVRRDKWTPYFDVREEEKQSIIDAELPGMDEKDIKITVSNSVLTIKGERKTERYNKSFVRSFTLPLSMDSEKIEASFDRGILTVKIPKMPEKVLEVKVTGPPKRIINK